MTRRTQGRTASLADRSIRFGLVALTAFTPMAFGTVEPWSIALMEWGCLTLLLVFLYARLGSPGGLRSSGLGGTGLEIPVLLFLMLGILQTVPLPSGWLRAVSPGSARLWERSAQDDGGVGVTAGSVAAVHDAPLADVRLPGRRPVSVRPRSTLDRVLELAAFAAVLFLVAGWARRAERIVFLVTTVTTVGFLVAAEGLLQYLTWNGRIYWVRKVPPSSAFGPFVNHNHFAGYVEMVIPLAISLAFYHLEIRRRVTRPPVAMPGLWGLGWIVRGSGEEEARWGKFTLALFAAVLLIVTLFFSLSRGGILSASVGGLVLFALIWRRIASPAVRWAVALALPAVAVGLVMWIGGGVVKEQIGTYRTIDTESSYRARAQVWDALVRHLPDHLWVGSGLGAFEESFAPFAPAGSSKRWDRAHNDYLQLLWESGLAGSVLFLAGCAVFVRRYAWPALRSGEHALDLFRVACTVSLLSIGIHSLVDFNLQIGSNGFLCALLAGLLIALHEAVLNGPPERPMLVAPVPPAQSVIAGGA